MWWNLKKFAEQFDIRLISPSLTGGGSERVCLRLANQWAREGKKVELLLIRDEGTYRRLLDPRVATLIARKSRIRWALPWLARQLWRRPSVPTLAFGSDIGVALGLLKRARLVHAPIIYREWNLPEANISASSRWIYRVAIAHLDGAAAQTDFAADSLRRLGVNRIPIRCIANPVDLPVEWLKGKREMADADRRQINIVAVGRLTAQKRFDRLLLALADWHQRVPDFALKIAGVGELRAELELLAHSLKIADKVTFLGWMDDVSLLYREADLFVLSSAYEGMPNALLEAILSGCRVLSSGGGGVRELLGELDLRECYLEDEDFGPNFGRKAETVLAMPASRWNEARQTLAAMTDMQQVAERYFDFCRRVASQEQRVV